MTSTAPVSHTTAGPIQHRDTGPGFTHIDSRSCGCMDTPPRYKTIPAADPLSRGTKDFWNGKPYENVPAEYDPDQARRWRAGWYFGSERYNQEVGA